MTPPWRASASPGWRCGGKSFVALLPPARWQSPGTRTCFPRGSMATTRDGAATSTWRRCAGLGGGTGQPDLTWQGFSTTTSSTIQHLFSVDHGYIAAWPVLWTTTALHWDSLLCGLPWIKINTDLYSLSRFLGQISSFSGDFLKTLSETASIQWVGVQTWLQSSHAGKR